MADPRVAVTIAAEDDASAVIRRVQDELVKLVRVQRDSVGAQGRSRQAASDAARALSAQADAARHIVQRTAQLAAAAKNTDTQAAALKRLAAWEQYLKRALDQTNLTLDQRLRLGSAYAATTRAIADASRPAAIGTSRFATALGSVQGALGTLGVAVGAAQLVAFAKGAIGAADSLNTLNRQTGVAVEQLQSLRVVAEQSGLSADDLSGIFARLSRALVELKQGDAEAAATFQAIGLTAKDLVGLAPDEVFERIAQQLAKLPAGFDRTTITMRLFGRGAAETAEFLEAVADGALPKMRAELKRTGALMSSETVKAADALNERLALLKAELTGLTANAVVPAIDRLTRIADILGEIDDELRAANPRLTTFGDGMNNVGRILAGLAQDAINPFRVIVRQADEAINRIEAMKRKATGVQSGPLAFHAVDGGGTSPSGDIPDPAKVRALHAAELSSAVAHADRMMALLRARLSLDRTLEDQAFARGEVALTEHYDRLAAITRLENGREVARLQTHVKLLKSAPVEANDPAAALRRSQEIADAENQVIIAQRKGQQDLAGLDEERRTRTLALQDQVLDFETQLASLRGNTAAATEAANARIVRGYVLALQQVQGLSDGAAEALAKPLADALQARAQFDRAQIDAQRALQALELDRETIRARGVAAHRSDAAIEADILALERQRQPALQAIAAEMLRFAQALGDPALVAAARQIGLDIGQIGVHVKASDDALRNLGATVRDAVTGDLAQFLGSTINQVHGVGDAFQQLGLSVVASIQQIIAQMIALRLVESTTSLFGGGGKAGTAFAIGQTVAGAISGVPGFASGGLIPGSSPHARADNYLARVTAGEYVFSRDRVRSLGVDFLDALHYGSAPVRGTQSVGIPRFADGGLVSPLDVAGGMGGTLEIRVLDEMLEARMTRWAGGKAGQRAIVKHAQRNAKAMSSAITR